MTRANAEQVKGNTDTLILAALSHEPLHGYAIARRIEELTEDHLTINEGSLYPALHRLEQQGAVMASWETSGGRRRKCYRITKRGRRLLVELTEEWRRFCTSVNRVLGVAPGG